MPYLLSPQYDLDVYSQIYRVLKPGQIFACYEWCTTPLYDKENAFHRQIKKKIEEGTAFSLTVRVHSDYLKNTLLVMRTRITAFQIFQTIRCNLSLQTYSTYFMYNC